ncbi:MAG TPA: hypothetical protein VGH36_04495 [Acetobacteraceae bacterium]|jgi:hypothetical protein
MHGMWETPRNIAILAGTVAAITAAIAGTLGYKIAATPPQSITVHLDGPIAVQQVKP